MHDTMEELERHADQAQRAATNPELSAAIRDAEERAARAEGKTMHHAFASSRQQQARTPQPPPPPPPPAAPPRATGPIETPPGDPALWSMSQLRAFLRAHGVQTEFMFEKREFEERARALVKASR